MLKKGKRTMGLVSLCLAVMLMLGACGGGAPAISGSGESTAPNQENGPGQNTQVTTKAGAVTQGTGADKDDLVFCMVTEPSSLNPGEYGDQPSKLLVLQIYETLVRESVGDRTKLEPLLAESWAFNETGDLLTFKIKEGVKFHSGKALTAEDVAFSLNKAIAEPTNLSLSSMMDKAAVVDESHVELKLKYAYSPVVSILAIPTFSIINKEYYEKCKTDGTNFGRNPDGTGPYELANWTAGSHLKLKANENWHNERAKITNVEFRVMTDGTTAAMALEAGDVDVFWGVDSADLPRLRSNKDINVLSVQSSGFYYIAMNQSRKPFDNEKVRQAIAYCIDRQEIIDGGQDGVGWVTECMITPGIFGHQEDFHTVKQDFDKAKQLLAEAGYPDGLTISMITPEASYYARPAQVVQEQLRKGGITLDLQIMERGAFNNLMAQRDFETCYYWVGANYPDADAIVYTVFHKQYANITGDSNLSNVVSDEATNLVEKARASMDMDERYRLYGELSKLNSDNAWFIPVLTSTNSICARVDVAGCYGHSAALYHVADWHY